MTSSRKGFSWQETKAGLRTILYRNALLIILIQILNQCVVNFKNSFRSLVVMNVGGHSATVLGVLMSFFTIVALLSRAPTGIVIDRGKKHVKALLFGIAAVKACVPLLMLVSLDQTYLWFVFFIDSVTWSAIQIVSMALMAVIVDKKAMGSAFAIQAGINTMVSSYPRGWGVTCFNSFGFETTTWITFAAGLLLLPLIAALDNKKLQESYAVGASRRLPDRAAAQTETKKKGLLGNICLTALPLALLTGCTYFLQTLITTYGPVYATNNGFDWATGTAIGGTIAGVITVLIGFLCDIVNPFALVVVAFTCHLASPLILATTGTSGAFVIAIILFYTGRFSDTPLRVANIRRHTPQQQGAVSATIFLCMDVMTMLANTACGLMIDNIGYNGTFWLFVVAQALILGAAVIALIRSVRRPAVQG